MTSAMFPERPRSPGPPRWRKCLRPSLRRVFATALAMTLCACGENQGDGGDGGQSSVVNLSVEPSSVTEGDSEVTLTVTAAFESGTARAETTVTVSLTGDTASANDFSGVEPLRITIAAGSGSASGSISFVATDDDEDEEDETVQVTGTAAGLTVNPATLTIVDNDEPSESGWVPGQFLPDSTYAGQCRSPRSGADPLTGRRYPDIQGRTVDENNWLRSWSNNTYLWYDEIIDRDPGRYDDPLDYFDLLRTTARTASGAPRDRFHFTYDTDVWIALSQSGESAGYGASWTIISRSPPREAAIAYTDPGTPATDAGLRRGARIVSVDGIDFVNADGEENVDSINAALYPESAGETHTFEFRDVGEQTTRTVELTSEIITSTPVQHVGTETSPAGATVGYMLFNDHIRTAEAALIEAVRTFDSVPGGIDDLIVDMRYNGGGFLYIGSELAYMIAGQAATAGQVYERLEFNDKHPETNPVTGRPLSPIPFYDSAETATGLQRLPALNLRRVLILTGRNTCSASESVINGLRGIDIEVILIGDTTCGKPYGFYATDNCGTSYFTIQFRGVNAKGYGDYGDGFVPTPGVAGGEAQVPGCRVADDLTRALGDPAEGRLAAALAYRDTGTCPVSGAASQGFGPEADAPGNPEPGDGVVHKPPWLTNRILAE